MSRHFGSTSTDCKFRMYCEVTKSTRFRACVVGCGIVPHKEGIVMLVQKREWKESELMRHMGE